MNAHRIACCLFTVLTFAASSLRAEDPAPVVTAPVVTAPAVAAPVLEKAPVVDRAAALAADAAALVAAPAPAPAPAITWKRTTIGNAVAAVEISDYRASLAKFSLRTSHPLLLPAWREQQGVDRQTRKQQPLPVLDGFNSEDDMHGFWVGGLALNIQPDKDGPWAVVSADATSATLRLDRQAQTGLVYAMTYRMDASRPTVHVTLTVHNRGDKTAELAPLLRALSGIHQDDPSSEAAFTSLAWHTGGADGSLHTASFPSPGESGPIEVGGPFDYVALKSRFFGALWAPGEVTLVNPAVAAVASQVVSDETVSGTTPVVTGAQFTLSKTGYQHEARAGLYKQANVLVAITSPSGGKFQVRPGGTLSIVWSCTVTSMAKADLAVLTTAEQRIQYTDSLYKFFKSLAKLLTWTLTAIALVVQNYGLAVILLTLVIKAALHHFVFKQHASMAKMQKLMPEMKAMQNQYKGDRQKMAVKQMELYKKHGVNPLSGCLPVLFQIPIFFALYQAFSHSADMRGKSFLWVSDLTLPDQLIYLGFHLPLIGVAATINPLPIMYIAATLWMSLLMKPSPGMDPQQEQMMKMMRWMPVIFGLVFYNMPAGLVLYFTTSAILGAAEYKWVRHRLGLN